MKKFILKSALYIFLILIALEVFVRIFHLYTEDPPRYIDEYGVEKRVPGHQGYAVTGNRNQNFSEFRINKAGFNSEDDFEPTKENFEIAIIGDSFIEGFHQDYDDSTGEKIEKKLSGITVYEYGYAGYDLANQLHLVHAYKDQFNLIDRIVIYLNYDSDLERGDYEPDRGRIKMLNSTLFKIRDNIKLLAYGSKIGILEPVKRLAQGKTFTEPEKGYQTNKVEKTAAQKLIEDQHRIDNFKNLVELYGFDKNKTTILLDARKTSQRFLDYLKKEKIDVLDFSEEFERSAKPTTLIYDHHWNDQGRELIASEIAKHVQQLRAENQ